MKRSDKEAIRGWLNDALSMTTFTPYGPPKHTKYQPSLVLELMCCLGCGDAKTIELPLPFPSIPETELDTVYRNDTTEVEAQAFEKQFKNYRKQIVDAMALLCIRALQKRYLYGTTEKFIAQIGNDLVEAREKKTMFQGINRMKRAIAENDGRTLLAMATKRKAKIMCKSK